ncbi:MAG TPA: hypothetical protein VK821_19745 [Dehalococcoidia bacterium]|nr:hypothetical protein [Dehalococcoidia bacterium]
MNQFLRSLLPWMSPDQGAAGSAVDILCLANSRKRSGRCVAGLRVDGGGWLRPVSGSDPTGALTIKACRLDDGTQATLLDVIRLTVLRPLPEPHQPENWLVATRRWNLVERCDIAAATPLLESALTSGPDLFGSLGDRIPYRELRDRPSAASLAVIEPQAVTWRISTSFRGNRQTRARITLSGALYDLSVTDPVFEKHLAALPAGVHTREAAGITAHLRVLLTVSLSEPFGATADCYKLVAAVIVLP